METLEFSKQYEANFQKTVHFIYKKCGDHEMSIDIAQAAWVRAWECRDKWRNESSFSTWVCNIAYFKWVEDWRKNHLLTQFPDNFDIKDTTTAPVDYAGMAEQLNVMIEKLNPNMQAVMRLRLDGMLVEEIAKLLGMKENTAKINSKRAMDKLKAMAAGR